MSCKETCEHDRLGLKFEYTATSTPQQNGRVERTFQIYYGGIRVTLLGCGIETPIRNRLLTEATNTVIDLDTILVSPKETTTSSFRQFFGEDAEIHINTTKKFGEHCVVTDQTHIKADPSDGGKSCN